MIERDDLFSGLRSSEVVLGILPRVSAKPVCKDLQAAFPYTTSPGFSFYRFWTADQGWALACTWVIDSWPVSRAAWLLTWKAACRALVHQFRGSDPPSRVWVLAPPQCGSSWRVPPSRWRSVLASALQPLSTELLPVVVAGGPAPVSSSPCLSVGERHWWPATVPDHLSAFYDEAAGAILAEEALPFVAGSFRAERLLEVAARRAPHLSHQLPLSYPVRWSEVAAAVPLVLRPLPLRPPGFSRALREDLTKALDCGALKLCQRDDICAASPMFSVVQSEKTRLIFDVRQVNAGVDVFNFSLEGVTAIPVVAAGTAFCSKLDLSSAYWQVPIDEELASRMGTWTPDGLFARWEVLPFGLAVAPFAFASITHCLVRAWRAAGIRCLAYLDDILIFAQTLEEHARVVRTVVLDLLAAGLRISSRKAFLLPFRRLDALGVTVDLSRQAFFVAPTYISKVLADVRAALAFPREIPRKLFESLFGRLGFVGIVHPFLNVRRSCMAAGLSCPGDSAAPSSVAVSTQLREELEWWASPDALSWLRSAADWDALPCTRLYATSLPGRLSPSVSLSSDASESGIGLSFLQSIAAEPLPSHLVGASSAARELYAILRVIQRAHLAGAFSRPRSPFAPMLCVRVVSDAQTAVASLCGTTVATSSWPIVWAIVEMFRRVHIKVSFEWLPREQLGAVDLASRSSAHDWTRCCLQDPLRRELYALAWGPGGWPDVELFADAGSRVGAKVWCARFAPPGSGGDGLDCHWWQSHLRLWIFPPFSLVRAVVRRLVAFLPKAVAILPSDDDAVMVGLSGWRRVDLGVPLLLVPPEFEVLRSSPRPLSAFFSPRV